MPIRLLHTSDWHLGHSLDAFDRHEEHQAFLEWLITTAQEARVHAVLVSGDVFDTSNPPVRAQSAYYHFLRELRAALPEVRVVITGGNHDSGVRLDAPRPLLDELGVHVVGAVPTLAEQGHTLDVDRLVVPVEGEGGRAWVVAMPYIRLQDLPSGAAESPEAVVAGIQGLYAEAIGAAMARRAPGEPIVAMGHAYFENADPRQHSERAVQLGNQAALPAAVFGPEVRYAALGHLHLAQTVRGNPHLRYSGSPIPLAMDEREYPHQVVLVELSGDEPARVESRRVPRTVQILRVPEAGTASLEEALMLLRQLPAADPEQPTHRHPLLEVRLTEAAPGGDHRARVEQVLAGRAARLVRLHAPTPAATPLTRSFGGRDLREVSPEEVFRARWRSVHPDAPGEPGEALMAAFREIAQRAAEEGGAA